MARICALTGKKVQFGHNVSHSKRATNRRFEPNLQSVTLRSDALGQGLRMRVSTSALRSVQKKGGLDAFLLSTDDTKLPESALRIKRKVKKKLGAKAQPSTG
jgi:large subunit ribosomal protein L28